MKYTIDFCREKALKYEKLKDFRQKEPSMYAYILKYGWQDVLSHLTRSMGSYYRFIYAYEFKEFNCAYVGLTYNINMRHEKHQEKGTVFDFIKEKNITLEPPKILEEKVVYTQAGEREAYYIDLYKKNGWNMLNKAKPGGLGSGRKHSKEIVMFDNRGDFIDKGTKIYIVEKYGILGGHISNCLAKRSKTTAGYVFMYKSEWEKNGCPTKIHEVETNVQEEIALLNDDLTIKKVFPSKKEATEYCGYKWGGNNLRQLHRNTIANCNKGKCVFYHDYLKYMDGELELYDPKIPRYKKLYLLPLDGEEREEILKKLIEGPKWIKNKNLKRLKPFHMDLHKPDDYVASTAKCLLQFDFDGNLIKEYGSGRVFAKENNIKNWRHLRSAANGKRDSAFGFIWIYKDEYSDELLKEKVEKVKFNLKNYNIRIFNKNKENTIISPTENADEQ